MPDFSTLSRRGLGLRLPAKPRVDRTEPIHLTMDSTGLKIFGEGEWLQVKHETKAKRKSWRKLHLGLDLTTGEIICSDLTLDHVGDSTALPGLLDQFDGPVSRFLADGAYDGTPTRNLLTARFGDAVEVIIPPPKNAVLALKSRDDPSLRDQQHRPDTDVRPTGMASQKRLQSAQSRGSTNWSLEKCDRAETEIAAVRKSEN